MNASRSWFVVLAVLLLAAAVGATTTRVLVAVKASPSPWHDNELGDKIVERLSRDPGFNVIAPRADDAGEAAIPSQFTHLDTVVQWTQEMGGRYAVIVEVTEQRLERRKSFNLPQIFHKYQAVGVTRGVLRIVDASRGRLLAAEPFEIKLKGPGSVQASTDDSIDDPALHLSAADKLVFFDRLETKVTEWVTKRFYKIIRNR